MIARQLVELDLGAGVGGEDDPLALVEGHGDAVAGLGVEGAGADGLDDAGLGLVLGGLGEEDAALGLGLSAAVPGRNPAIDGFGLIAFASLFPIMSVMAYAQLSEARAAMGRQADQTESTESTE